MAKLKSCVCLFAVVLLLSGCATSTKTAPYMGALHICDTEMDRSEYVLLDTVVGKANSTYILFGLIENADDGQRILGIGPSRKSAVLNVYGGLYALLPGGGGFTVGNRAYYNALSQVPDADTILPMTKTQEYQGFWPIVWSQGATVSGKAMKIKTDKEMKR